MATQTTTEPTQSIAPEEGSSSVRKGGDLQETHLTQLGLVVQDSHTTPLKEAVVKEEVMVEEEVVEEDHLEPQEEEEVRMTEIMAQS